MDEDVYSTYLTSSELMDEVLFKQAVSMKAVGGKTRKILHVLNRISSRRITSRMLYNFWNNRLGGGTALEGFETLIERFAGFSGADCLVIEDEDDQVTGVVLQTQMQRDLFDMYGDNVIFDWTHNMNNLGFHVGAFLVTTASGHGVSVADFMSTNQTKDTMTAMFNHFLAKILQRDHEWAVLQEVFAAVKVLLYQFHAVKWFKKVILEAKYNLSAALRPDVLTRLRAMMYARTDREFGREQALLADLLSAPQHQLFCRYLEERLYNCVPMWADCRRKKVSRSGPEFPSHGRSNVGRRAAVRGGQFRTCVDGADKSDLGKAKGRNAVQVENAKAQKAKTIETQSEAPSGGLLWEIEDIVAALKSRKKKIGFHRTTIEMPLRFTDVALSSKQASATRQEVSKRHGINFTILKPVFQTIRGAMNAVPDLDNSTTLDVSTVATSAPRVQRVAYLIGDMVQLLVECADASSLLSKWRHDLQWLTSTLRWTVSAQVRVVSFLQREADVIEGEQCTMNTVRMGGEVRSALEKMALHTILYVDDSLRLSVGSVIGSLAGKAWLNDAVINYALNSLSKPFADVIIIDSLNHGTPMTPNAILEHTRVVSFPINYNKLHWCAVNVLFDWSSRRHHVCLYDPTNPSRWMDRLQKSWQTWCLPPLLRWQSCDAAFHADAINVDSSIFGSRSFLQTMGGGVGGIGEVVVCIMNRSAQAATDGWNCGVLAIVHTFAYISGEYSFHQRDKLSELELDILRLRLLWLIVCPSRHVTDQVRAAEARRNGATLAAFTEDEFKV